MGTAPGLWIDSSNAWGAGWSLQATDRTRPSLSHEPSWFCRASEPIKSMFREAFIYHIREEGVRELKFDNLHCALQQSASTIICPGVYSTEAIENSVIEFLHDLDKECPDVFIHALLGIPFALVAVARRHAVRLGHRHRSGQPVVAAAPLCPR